MAELFAEKPYVSNQVAEFGPVLTDEEFFDELDDKIPALAEARDAFLSGDKALAYKGFADYLKSILKPEVFLNCAGRVVKPEFDENLQKKTERAMNHYFVSCGIPMQFGKEIDWLANPTPNNYSEWRIQLQHHAELLILARAYRATGDEKYAEELTTLIMHWIKHVPRCPYDSGSYGPTHTWRTLECGTRCNSWTEMVHSLMNSPYFTDEVCVTMYKTLYEHQMRISTGYTHGNWLFIELNGMATLTSVTPVFKKSRGWREDVGRRLLKALETMVYPDGWQYELSPGYMSGCLRDSREVEEVFRAYGYKMPDRFYEIIDEMVNCYVKARMANGLVPPINDSGAVDCARYIASTVALYGGNDAAKWVVSGGKEGHAPEYNSILMPYAGFVALRTGWGEDDVSAFFDAGKYGRDHFHDDKLNLLIYNSKKPLVSECGTYAYDMSMMRNYAVNTEGHNTVMVDGYGQCRFEGHWEDPTHWAHTKEEVYLVEKENLDYAWGIYRENYGVCDYSKLKRPEVPGRKLVEHVREVVMMKRPAVGKPYFIAVDTLTDKIGESHTYEALWHLEAESATIVGEKVLSEDVTLITYGFDEMVCYKGSEEPHQGWLSRSATQGANYPAPAVVAKKCGKNVTFVTLIAPDNEERVSVKSVEICGSVVTVTHKSGEVDKIDLADLRREAGV